MDTEVVDLRLDYDEEKLKELAQSLSDEGQLQPIVVQRNGNRYGLIFGSRRLQATKLGGQKTIDAYVTEGKSPLEMMITAICENLQRQDLNPFEESRAFIRLMNEHDLGTQELAKKIGKHETYVRNRVALMGLDGAVRNRVADGEVGLQYVPVLAGLSPAHQRIFVERVAQHRLTVNELRLEIEQVKAKDIPRREVRRCRTPEKILSQFALLSDWIEGVPRQSDISSWGEKDVVALRQAITQLQSTLEVLESAIARERTVGKSPNVTQDGFMNTREQWTNRDISAITAKGRPSDQILSKRIGRTRQAIATMRHSVRKTSKKKT